MWCSAIGVIVTLSLSILAAPLVADAQPAGKMYRIGRLAPGFPPTPTRPNPGVEALWQGLREFGYVEGQNLIIEYRYAEGRNERLADLAAELVRLKVEVLVAIGDAAIHAAQHATHMIPVVMAVASDPVAQGFVASLAHPGGNMTGLSNLSAELPGKRLELLKEAVPQTEVDRPNLL
jgi:putative ABC transport system substrate-binding protein